jgi:hypothetical protein
MDAEATTPGKSRTGKDPQTEKQLDYKHQRRTSEGGKGWRKAVARLPRRERRLYRQAQERALREALLVESAVEGEEATGLTAGDNVRGLKRSRFRVLDHRREIPLGKRVALKRAGITRLMYRVPAGRKRGRHLLPRRNLIRKWVKEEGRGANYDG